MVDESQGVGEGSGLTEEEIIRVVRDLKKEAEDVFIVKERRYWCTRPRCTARYFVRMAMNTGGEEGEKLRRQLKELIKKNPYVAKEIERLGREVLRSLS